MGKQFIVILLSAVFTMPAWAAESDGSPTEERIGVGTGAVIGAIAGGPIGLMIGAALGAWTGDKFHRERSARQDVEARYSEASDELVALEELLQGNEQDLSQLRSEWSARESQYRDALQGALEVEVYFHTDAAALDADTQARLERIADLIASMDEIAVVVAGFADARGDETYNEQLSARRAAVVRDALIKGGVPATRITANAEGERQSTAAEQDFDALALERRVRLSIVDKQFANRVARQ